ncbi:hypothetical protein SAMN05660860_03251 [Geoalkalibacter ferrihydriticus]|uniref:Peptidase M15B domain-containing protein n=2 Tax=Geoalkalibacter ferrihydriticus TaxID=392333 RepID=A0A0C2HEU3_9BACT|nr:hypothetical protein [Geoalkalibacter ferrihydriticus]KIH75481.1 hypothetical protein GFER_16115 [Geoalkalibacter ferrihydriticus DSM 17813]SDM84138.1 hypothetical protein SAMN05660860_03251 [Geoalkalibacter ferrihydriticus]
MVILPEPLRLKLRVNFLILHLRGQGIPCWIQAHYRTPDRAHRWSTAYSVLSGKINVGDLRCLADGRDLDGNLWFKPEWAPGAGDRAPANEFAAIVANANELGPRKPVYAEEGYASTDPRRRPNLAEIPISKHITGRAIDLNVEWAALGGPWSAQADELIARYGLCRPVTSESWHVERNKAHGMNVPLRELFVAIWKYLLRRFK